MPELAAALAALEATEKHYHSLFDSSLSGFALHEIICDADGCPVDYRFLEVNPAFEQMTGLRRSEIVGKTVLEVLPGVEPLWIERYGRVALTGQPEHFEAPSQPLHKTYEVAAFSPCHGQFAVSITDITLRKQAEAEQQRLTRALRMISECNQTLVRVTEQEALYSEVCQIVVQDGGYGLAWVALSGPESPALRVVAQAAHDSAGDFDLGPELSRPALLQRLSAAALASSQPIIARGSPSGREPADSLLQELANAPIAVAVIPLRAGDVSLGVLGVFSAEVDAFDDTELPLLLELAGDLAFGISTMQALAERERAEAVLRESEERYRTLVECSPSAIFIECEGIITFINSAGLALFGATGPQEIIGRQVLDLVHPDSRQVVSERGGQVKGQWSTVSLLEEKYLRLDGQVVDVIVTASPILHQGKPAAQVIAHDISGQRRAEAALAQTETLFRRVIEQSSDGIAVADGQGRVIEWNPAMEQITGLARDEVLGELVWDVNFRLLVDGQKTEELRYRMTEEFHRYLVVGMGQPPSRVAERPIRRPDGTLRIVQMVVYGISTGTGRMLAAVARDVTVSKQREENLLQQQRMESIGVLAGGIAHDFNNLLTSVLGQMALAATKLDSAHPSQVHLDKAIKSSQRATDLTRQLLAYAGKGRTFVSAIDINTLVHDNLGLLETAIPKAVELKFELAEALPMIDADLAQIQQVLMNLVINAAEAADDRGGRVSVRTYLHEVAPDEDPLQFVSTAVPLPGPYVCLEVGDNGRGMDGAVLAHIFDPFFSTKGTGRGLGLAAMLGIVRSHAGGLSVVSRPGQGSTFRVFFPLQARGEPSPADRQAPSLATVLPLSGPPAPAALALADRSAQEAVLAAKRPLVLVIDDEEPVREALTDIFEMAGYRILTARDGQEGLGVFLVHQAEIRLVVLDLLMPVVGGEETLRRLRLVDPQIKVILSSGYDEEEAERRFRQHSIADGPDDFIAKPYNVKTIVAKVRKLIPQDYQP